VIYVYAICEPGRPLPDGCEGLDDAPVALLEHERVAAAHSVHSTLELRAEPGPLWRHERVVQRLMERGPVLPARFGTTFNDERARERESIAERTLAPLNRLAADARRRDPLHDPAVISASYLVPEGQLVRFTEEVRALQRHNDELEVSCTGPWAPYSFAEEDS